MVDKYKKLFERFESLSSKNEKFVEDEQEECKTDEYKDILTIIQELKVSGKLTEGELKNLRNENNIIKWLISILLAAISVLLPIFLTNFTQHIEKTHEVYHSQVQLNQNTILEQIKNINQRMDYQEKLNIMQIQRDVAIEVKK